MRPLQVPTTAITNPDGTLTNEWKIFLSEVIRTAERLDNEKMERGIWYNKLLS